VFWILICAFGLFIHFSLHNSLLNLKFLMVSCSHQHAINFGFNLNKNWSCLHRRRNIYSVRSKRLIFCWERISFHRQCNFGSLILLLFLPIAFVLFRDLSHKNAWINHNIPLHASRQSRLFYKSINLRVILIIGGLFRISWNTVVLRLDHLVAVIPLIWFVPST